MGGTLSLSLSLSLSLPLSPSLSLSVCLSLFHVFPLPPVIYLFYLQGVSLLLLERGMKGITTTQMACQGAWSSGTACIFSSISLFFSLFV
jgi:hypothetical protein